VSDGMGQTWRCVVGLEFHCPARRRWNPTSGNYNSITASNSMEVYLFLWRGFSKKRKRTREIGQASAETKWDTHDIAKVRPRGPCDPLVGCGELSWTQVRYIGQSMPWREDCGRYCAACLPIKEDAERSRLCARMVVMCAG